ncbi:helix-turn-helix transcriptional regulator [Albidovulum sp.]|uniref:helix-turn-helix transcriptional regulator n=1 Tax=Albidovulum sp. TaxID=1872424 RepID=UPI001DC1F355|nr:helix-turn-helix transcriptional regulator [Paracoccaceae bacterium]MCB2121330.1 helix-turn-helix transcriptional regulator [Paracoccaceae bacterium]MCB2131520.1 helix-turn-helix transcriptional regulator [Paracoccaceae bacterium]MCB2138440.1 helix-turn-helix transcriptional regulator [Paracoccaceae bacterium]MCB2152735.1 helix-turn-helix transcriptional regulator [Paracoccaceae bacterium]
MPAVSRKTRTISAALAALIILQGFCAAFFLSDLVRDLMEYKDPRFEVLHFALEVIANLALLAGAVVEAFFLAGLLRRQARADRALSAASGALHDLMEGYFADWGLTASEADVATFTIKGFTIAEVAAMRGSAEATVKTHLNAIYRKAGVAGRAQLVSHLIEDLMRGALPGPKDTRADVAGARAQNSGTVA